MLDVLCRTIHTKTLTNVSQTSLNLKQWFDLKTLIETSRTQIKRLPNLLGNSWTRCWSFSFIWRFCWFQIRNFHVGHLEARNLPPIILPNIRISWDVGQHIRPFCLSLLRSLVSSGLTYHLSFCLHYILLLICTRENNSSVMVSLQLQLSLS